VALLPEHVVPAPGWTVAALVSAGWARAAGSDASSVRRPSAERTRRSLEAAGIGALARRRLATLSRGEARSALLAYALAGSPGLVLLDEPWSGLEPRARARLTDRIRALRDAGATVVVSSHELLEVARVADRVLMVSRGVVAREVNAIDPAALLQLALQEPNP
jgi:ABC-type multidrug transport system ATPase subunit